MKRLLYLPIVAILLVLQSASCTGRHQSSGSPESLDSIASAWTYAECIGRLKKAPDRDGYLYHITFYKAIDCDSLSHYSSFLDSISEKVRPATVKHYVMAHRLLSGFLLTTPGFDTLKSQALSLPQSLDLTQEEVFAHTVAKSLVSSDVQQAFNMQMRAVQAMRHGGRYRPSEVLSQAALICSNLGQYPTAMDYLNEAADTLSARGWPRRETVFMLGNKAALYHNLEMLDSALSVNEQALRIASNNPSLTADLLTSRAQMFAELQQRDSAYGCLDRAELAIGKSSLPYAPLFRRHIRARKAVLMSGDSSAQREDLVTSVGHLEEFMADKRGTWEEQFAYGHILFRLGDRSGIELMRQAHDSLALAPEPRALLWAKRNLINVYNMSGMTGDAAREYHSAFALVDTLNARQARYLAMAKEVEYHIRLHTRENDMLKRAHRQDQSKVMWLTIATLLGVALLIWAAVFIVMNRRLQHKQRVVDSHQIMMLVENRKALNRHIEEMQNESEEAGLDWNQLTPSSMSSKDTTRFRKSFVSLYPDFIEKLHNLSPDLTVNDENLCMLIKIGQSSDDIALALGISKPSVNSARYRIRKKMGLGKDESLNDVINNL